jgi:hypothetical protein
MILAIISQVTSPPIPLALCFRQSGLKLTA